MRVRPTAAEGAAIWSVGFRPFFLFAAAYGPALMLLWYGASFNPREAAIHAFTVGAYSMFLVRFAPLLARPSLPLVPGA